VIGITYSSDPRTCPVRAWQAWLNAAGIDSGAAFGRHGRYGQVTEHRLSANYVLRLVKELGSKAEWRLARAFAETDPAKGLNRQAHRRQN
jgi:hypothetical protein